MTASLAGFLGSIFWGTVVIILPITAALILVSRLDPLGREDA
jgi:hypothetical protein